jgi:hypothetical protein
MLLFTQEKKTKRWKKIIPIDKNNLKHTHRTHKVKIKLGANRWRK